MDTENTGSGEDGYPPTILWVAVTSDDGDIVVAPTNDYDSLIEQASSYAKLHHSKVDVYRVVGRLTPDRVTYGQFGSFSIGTVTFPFPHTMNRLSLTMLENTNDSA